MIHTCFKTLVPSRLTFKMAVAEAVQGGMEDAETRMRVVDGLNPEMIAKAVVALRGGIKPVVEGEVDEDTEDIYATVAQEVRECEA